MKKILVLMAVAAVATGCGKKEANPTISLALGNYTAQNSINRLMDWLMPSAYAVRGDGKLCFKRLRFKKDGETTAADPTQDPGNLDFSPGEVVIGSGVSADLGKVAVPAGTYKRVEFDFEKDCVAGSSGNSVSYDAGSGLIVTQQNVTVKFEGSFEASESGQKLTLGMAGIIAALNAITSPADIKVNLEAASVKGNF
jgi:hypothetical protein